MSAGAGPVITLDPIKAALAPYMLAIKAAVLLLAFIGGCSHGAGKWKGKYEDEARAREHDNIAWESIVESIAERTRAAAAAAKQASELAKSERAANNERFKELTDEAEQARSDLAAALRRGTGPVRLRDEWACAAPRSAEGGTGSVASRQDAGADLRAAGAADLVAAGDAADRWIGWLQSELISTRKACGVDP